MFAIHPFHPAGHSNSGSHADLPGDLDVPVGPLRMKGMIQHCKHEEQLYALPGDISRLGGIILASHLLNS
jgi:hypothetical protein